MRKEEERAVVDQTKFQVECRLTVAQTTRANLGDMRAHVIGVSAEACLAVLNSEAFAKQVKTTARGHNGLWRATIHTFPSHLLGLPYLP